RQEETHLGLIAQHNALLACDRSRLSAAAVETLVRLGHLEAADYEWAAELAVREVVRLYAGYADAEKLRVALPAHRSCSISPSRRRRRSTARGCARSPWPSCCPDIPSATRRAATRTSRCARCCASQRSSGVGAKPSATSSCRGSRPRRSRGATSTACCRRSG